MATKYKMLENGEFELDADGNKIPIPDPSNIDPGAKAYTNEEIQAMIKEGVEAQLAPMKQNLDNAYAARDEANAKAAKLEQEKKDADIARMKEEGKHKEAYEAEVAQERAKREAADKRVVELTRDVELRGALGSVEFRNKKSQDMAFKEISGELVQNENNEWVHKSGVAIDDYVKTYTTNEDNAFLLKQAVSTGAGTTVTKTGSPKTDEETSLFKRSQADVLKDAEAGALPHQQQN